MKPTTSIFFAALAVLASGALLVAQNPAPAPATPAPAAPAARGPKAPPRLPPPGVAIPEADRAELAAGAAELKREIDALTRTLQGKRELLALLPDVEIFHKAADWPLRHNEFYNVKEIATAKKLLALGKERASALAKGEHPWTAQTGLVVRGYRSRVDGSVQPYGLVIPDSWKAGERRRKKALVWLLGRGNTRTELAFLNERLNKPPEFTAPDGFTLIPYGRFCNATKFAGESDVFEALAELHTHYDIDPARVAVAGFSMGGASAWHLGAHHAGMWSFVSPGAGFAETREYAKVFAPGKVSPPPWEQTLWRWYDATDYVVNLGNVPTLAYSGELDKQIQAAEIMLRYAEKEGVKIEHFIGPKTEHKHEPETRKKMLARMEEIWARPNQATPPDLRFVTYTLIYPRLKWITVTGMDRPWERAEVNAKLDGTGVAVTTKNVSSLALDFGTGPNAPSTRVVTIDGQRLEQLAARPRMEFARQSGNWAAAGAQTDPAKARGGTTEGIGIRSHVKKPGLCGPIDHAFMHSFVHVRPTGAPQHEKVGAWAASELEHARAYWRQIFRGDAPVKDDTAITDADIRNSNLVLWGDPASNAVLKRIVASLPLEWTKEKLLFGGQTYDPAKTAPILIFPNPLNPEKYVVLNSGVTFRESAMGTNSQQTPKLPDWAIIDLDTPPGPDWPGKVVQAGFFDSHWKYTAEQPSQPE